MVDQPAGTPGPQDPLLPVQSELERIDVTELPDQVAVYERIHATLAAALAGTVEQAVPGAGGR